MWLGVGTLRIDRLDLLREFLDDCVDLECVVHWSGCFSLGCVWKEECRGEAMQKKKNERAWQVRDLYSKFRDLERFAIAAWCNKEEHNVVN